MEETKNETIEQYQNRIRKICEDPALKNAYLTQHMIAPRNRNYKILRRESIEKCFKQQYFGSFCWPAVQRRNEKIENFKNRDHEYLSTLLKKLKKIFNAAKKEKDLKQLNYLDKKIGRLMLDKNYFRKNFNGGSCENKIVHDFEKIYFEVKKEIKLLGEN